MSWRDFKDGLTGRLAFSFALFALFPLCGMGLFAYLTAEKALLAATISERLSSAIEKESALDAWMEGQTREVAAMALSDTLITAAQSALAGSPEAVKRGEDLGNELRKEMRADRKFTGISLIDAVTGRILASSDSSERGLDVSSQGYFRGGKTAPTLEGPYLSKKTGKPELTAAAPILSPKGNLLGVLAAHVDRREMEALINRRSGLRRSDEAFLVNMDSIFLTQPRFQSEPVVLRKQIHTQAVRAVLSRHSGYITNPDYRGVPCIVIYRWLPKRQMALMSKIDEAEAFAPIATFRKSLMLIGLLTLFAASAMAFMMAKTITKPILALQKGADRFGRGDLDFRLPETSGDEFGMLAREFNRMAATIAAKRMESEVRLVESEERFFRFMESVPAGIFVLDGQGNSYYANQASKLILGAGIMDGDKAEGLTEKFKIVRAGTDEAYPVAELPIVRALAGETVHVQDVEVQRPDRRVPVEVTAIPLLDSQGRVEFAIAAFMDISERKQVAAELQSALIRAEAASRTKSDFLATMSHELRTPLNSVIGFAQILLKNKAGTLREQDLTYLSRIHENGRHLLVLINNILDLSKVEAGRMEVNPEPVQLGLLIPEILSQFEAVMQGKDLKLLNEIPEGLRSLQTDPVLLKQVLLNLIGNALKFTQAGHVMVRVLADAESRAPLGMEIEDTGIGIPLDRQAAVFEAFQQANNSTAREFGGTGLGLAISKAMLQLMGFSLGLRSEPGAGSTFSISFHGNTLPAPKPVTAIRSVSAGPRPPAEEIRPEGSGSPLSKLVVIIDDDSDSRVLMTEYLSDLGFRVASAESGPLGLALCRDLRPDFITLDLFMPGMNGWKVLNELKSDPSTSGIPVAIVSIVAGENRQNLHGAMDLLEKPVNKDELSDMLLKNRISPRPKVLLVDDSEESRLLLADMLKLLDCEAMLAGSGPEALRILDGSPPDLILLDFVMPGMDGLAFMEELRKHPGARAIPVVIVTAKDLSQREQDKLQLCTLAVLKKSPGLENRIKPLLAEAFGRSGPIPPFSATVG